jgi:2-keto-4-pentenoate hydratase/2-oxohepta-3-ene-1,7-dioic acid hydratase in catechol pathway
MKIGLFNDRARRKIGIVEDDLQSVRLDESGLGDITPFLAKGFDPARHLKLGPARPLAGLGFLPPIVPDRNIFCVGKNYAQHAQEFNQSGFDATSKGKDANIDEFAAIFSKPPSSLVGHDEAIDAHAHVTSQVDYEAELAVIIGRAGKSIPRSQAYDYVWGYSIVNDVTARDLQQSHRQWFVGKGFDTFCPMGPWMTSADEIEPENLDLECRVNGELRQKAHTSDLIFDIPHLIETLSAGIRLKPGDIIATGTPAGVGIGFDPPRFLKAGDTIEISISGLGTLRNSVI